MTYLWWVIKGFIVGVITAPIIAVLHIWDMTIVMPREARRIRKAKGEPK